MIYNNLSKNQRVIITKLLIVMQNNKNFIVIKFNDALIINFNNTFVFYFINKFAREFFQKNFARNFKIRTKFDKIAKFSRDFIYFAR